MKKPKPTMPMNIRFTEAQRRWIKLTAKAQGHWNASRVVKNLIAREMQAHEGGRI